jgi:hypothetical protein
MIQNYDKFSKWNSKLTKFAHFKIFIFIQWQLTKNMWSIGTTITSCKKIHSKKYISYEKKKKTKNQFTFSL